MCSNSTLENSSFETVSEPLSISEKILQIFEAWAPSASCSCGEAALLRIELDVGEDSERVLAWIQRDAKKP